MDTGRTTQQQQQIETIPEPGTLEALGYTIRPAPKGGGFLLYHLGDKEEAIDIVRDTQKWLDETAHILNIQSSDPLKKSLIKAKATPKRTTENNKNNPKVFEIVTSDIYRGSPDSGVVEGKAYLGIWLPAKVTDDKGTSIQQVFHLLFSDGELVAGDPETLSNRGMFLSAQPIFTPLKVSVETVLNLAELQTVNPIEIVNKIITLLKKYIEFDDQRYYALVAFWIVGSYFHKMFGVYPYLFINAVKRSGKTKLLTILSLLAYNSVFSPNMSTSSLFRLTQSAGATTLLDETEDLNDPERKAEFKSLLFSGYKRGAYIYRTEKGPNDSYIPTPYDAYSPKAIANINGLEDVLEDRCISLTMKRGRDREIINRDVPLEDPIWNEMRNALTKLYLQEYNAVNNAYIDMQDDIKNAVSVLSAVSVVLKRVQEKNNIYNSRTWECWKPLFSLGKYVYIFSGKPHIDNTNNTNNTNNTELTPYEQLLDLSVDLISEKETENITETGESLLLIGMLKTVSKDAYYNPMVLINASAEFTDALPQWFNAKWVGKALKRLGFKDKRRCGNGVQYRLIPKNVEDMADRLGVKIPEKEPETPNDNKKRLCKYECEHWGNINDCPEGSGSFNPDIEVPTAKPCLGYQQKGTGDV
jgi:hypothetical protein